jgi:hypothetical protein
VSKTDDVHPRDRCPDCGRPLAVVLEGATGAGLPARFVWCARHERLWVQVAGSFAPVVSRHARLLAREVLRLKGLLAQDPERRAN